MKSKKLPSPIILAILTLITVLFWVSFSIYRSFTSVPETPVDVKLINPVVPSLDSQTIENVKNRISP